MNTWYEFTREETHVMVAGKSIEGLAVGFWAYDDSSVEGSFDFGNEADNDAYLARFESNELVNLTLKVEVRALGETGTTYLGSVHVTGADDDYMLECFSEMQHDAVTDVISLITDKARLFCEAGLVQP